MNHQHGRPGRRHAASHRLERRGEHQERVGHPALADARGQVVGHDTVSEAQLPGQARHGAAVHACDDQPPDVAGLESGGLHGATHGLLAHGQVAVLAEALLPQPGGAVARGAPAVGELVGDRGGRHQLGQHVGPLAHQDGGAGVAAGCLVAARGQPVSQVGRHHQGGTGAAQRRDEAPHARAQGAPEVVGRHVAGQADGRRHRRRIRLVEIRRPRRGEPQRFRGVPGALRRANRAASTPSVVVSSSCDATARVPLPPPLPMNEAMSARARRR